MREILLNTMCISQLCQILIKQAGSVPINSYLIEIDKYRDREREKNIYYL